LGVLQRFFEICTPFWGQINEKQRFLRVIWAFSGHFQKFVPFFPKSGGTKIKKRVQESENLEKTPTALIKTAFCRLNPGGKRDQKYENARKTPTGRRPGNAGSFKRSIRETFPGVSSMQTRGS